MFKGHHGILYFAGLANDSLVFYLSEGNIGPMLQRLQHKKDNQSTPKLHLVILQPFSCDISAHYTGLTYHSSSSTTCHTYYSLFALFITSKMADLRGWKRALYRVRPQLQERIKIEHHISSLHEAVQGGFLTIREEEDIMSQTPDSCKVSKLVEILAKKGEKDFEAFAAFLKTIGQAGIAEELESAAKGGM